MIKPFVGVEEAIEILGTDYDGLRQVYELGLAKNLPAYMYLPRKGRLAVFSGRGVRVTASKTPLTEQGQVEVPILGTITADDWDTFAQISEQHAFITASEHTAAFSGQRFALEISGYFRVCNHDLSIAFSECDGTFATACVYPDLWTRSPYQFPLRENGEPSVTLRVLPHPALGDLPTCRELLFKPDDLRAYNQFGSSQTAANSKPLGTRERNTMLRLIYTLASMSDVTKRGGATAIDAHRQQLGLDGPGESTIRKLLNEALEHAPGGKT